MTMLGVCKNHFTGGSGSNTSKNTIQYTHLLWGHWSRVQCQSISNTNCTSSYISPSRRQNFKDRNHWFFPPKLYTFMFGHQPLVEALDQGSFAVACPSGLKCTFYLSASHTNMHAQKSLFCF